MRPAAFAFAACLALPAVAGEVGLFADKLQGRAQTDWAGNRYEAASPSGFGFRAGYALVNLKLAEIGFTASYRPTSEADLAMTSPAGTPTRGRMGFSYAALGAQVDWKLLVNIHAGLEMRREKLTRSGFADHNGPVSLNRPWARVGLGFNLPLPVLSPILRIEYSAPLHQESIGGTGNGNVLQDSAPRAQAAVYVGLRF